MEVLYNEILKTVCDYYGVKRYDVLMKRDCLRSNTYNKARCVAIFLIRESTGDAFKVINDFFQYNHATGALSAHGHVVYMTKKRIEYKKEVYELLVRVLGKINLVATL